jgi:hypothetical protein
VRKDIAGAFGADFVKFWVGNTVTALFGGVVGALALAFFVGLLPIGAGKASKEVSLATDSKTPALDHLDTLRCARGLQRIVQVRGGEDGFDREGKEPSRVDPAMLRFGLFADLDARLPRAIGRRDYDEGGVDRAFIDHFDIPQGAVSATLIMRLRAIGTSAQNDSIQLIPQVPYKSKNGVERLAIFGIGASFGYSGFAAARTAFVIYGLLRSAGADSGQWSGAPG